MAYASHLLGRHAHVSKQRHLAKQFYLESIAHSGHSSYWLAWNQYALGKIADERRDFEAATGHWRQALNVAQSLGMPLRERLKALLGENA